MAVAMTGITSAQEEFVQAVEGKVNQAFSSQLDGTFALVNYPSGFNWTIQLAPNNYYNSASLNELDLQVEVASNDILTLAGDNFSTLYAEILQAVSYVISDADNKTINQESGNASAQISTVISDYESSFGTITSTQMAAAIPPTKIGYIQARVQSLWGDDITKAPSSLAGFKTAYQTYQVEAAQMFAILSRSAQAQQELAAAIANASTPSATNGGLQTGASTYYVSYTGMPAQTVINSGLQTASNQVSISISLSDFSSDSSNLHVEGGAGITVDLADIFTVSIGGSSSYDLSKYTSSSSAVSMAITYPGITIIGTAPQNLSMVSSGQTTGSTGWYDNQILTEVVANAGKGTSVTGFQLQGSEFPVDQYFGAGLKFSRLKTFVISQQPTIVLTFQAGEASAITSDFKEQMSASVKLFGLFTIGSVSQSYEVQKVDTSSSSGTVTVTLGPPTIIGTVPDAQSTAYVVGGVPSYPPSDI